MRPSDEEIRNLNKLLDYERDEIALVFTKWQESRANKDWVEADRFRLEYGQWDETFGTEGVWLPIFETIEHWRKRIFLRMEKYGIAIYPFN